ncbi:MAG TPA: hypothetical protein VMT91_12520 [Anaerolineales bacterium]|nr:hypothetical protein [Anaerolineales bacterium]
MVPKPYTAYYEVHSSTREELNDGWVWIRNEADANLKGKLEARRRIVRMIYSKNPPVYCEALYVSDDYDIKWFNRHFGTKNLDSSRCKYPDTDSSDSSLSLNWNKELIFISQWYRQHLGIKGKLRTIHPLEIEIAESGWTQVLWQFRACLQHPQIVVLLSTVLGIISVGLGIIGFGIGLIAIPAFSRYLFSLINIIINELKCLGVVFVMIGAVTIFCGVKELFKRATYAPPS